MAVLDRLTWRQAALLVVDVQEKLVGRIFEKDRVISSTRDLIKAAAILEVPTLATEQYPAGLGPTVSELASLLPKPSEKTTFHCCAAPALLETLHGRGIRHVTLAGIEAHVCVAQTALELLKLGFIVQVPADAVGSRHRSDWELALRRLETAGAVVSSTEAAIFEWTEGADHPRFKEISGIVKESDRRRAD